MFFKGLIYCLTLLPLGILAALDDKSKLANRTIDRVSYHYPCLAHTSEECYGSQLELWMPCQEQLSDERVS